MEEYDYDWGQASALDFLNYRSLTTPAGNPRLNYVMPASDWTRATNPQMNRTVVDTGYAEKFLFDRLTNIDRLKIALTAAIKCFPAAVQGDLMILLSPSNLALIAATLMGFIALSAIGVGQIVGMGVAAYAWWVMGNGAIDYIKAVANFAKSVLGAKSEIELMQAGTKFGKATAHLSVDVFVAILTKRASVKMRESAGRIHELAKEKKLLFGKYDVNSAQRSIPKDQPSNTPKVVPKIKVINVKNLPAEERAAVEKTLQHIKAATKPEGKLKKKWGVQFKNYDGDLPGEKGAKSPYQEYRVDPPPGTPDAGARRIVVNSETGDVYYTWTHYGQAGTPPFVIID